MLDACLSEAKLLSERVASSASASCSGSSPATQLQHVVAQPGSGRGLGALSRAFAVLAYAEGPALRGQGRGILRRALREQQQAEAIICRTLRRTMCDKAPKKGKIWLVSEVCRRPKGFMTRG